MFVFVGILILSDQRKREEVEVWFFGRWMLTTSTISLIVVF